MRVMSGQIVCINLDKKFPYSIVKPINQNFIILNSIGFKPEMIW